MYDRKGAQPPLEAGEQGKMAQQQNPPFSLRALHANSRAGEFVGFLHEFTTIAKKRAAKVHCYIQQIERAVYKRRGLLSA